MADPDPAGIARYVRELVTALQGLAGVEVELWYRLSRARLRRYWWRPAEIRTHTWLGRRWPLQTRVDLLHGPDALLPPRPNLPAVATLHDLAVFRLAADGLASERFRGDKLRRYLATLARANRLIAVSEATARDAVELLGADPDKLRVVHHGVDNRFRPLDDESIRPVTGKYRLFPGYLLFVGTVSPRKNTERLVRAYARSHASHDVPLVLAGRVYHRSRSTLEAITELGLGGRVRCLGYVPDEDLPALYNGARALLLPSLYEGFGLPVLEALACGVPVLCGNRGGAPEVVGHLAIKVASEDINAIAEGIDALLDDPPGSPESRRAHAASFTWDRTARQTVAVYRELVD